MASQKPIDSTWVSPYNGKEWPIVLCDYKHPPEVCVQSRRDPFLCPAILLGKLKFVWIRLGDLKDFVPSKDYVEGLPEFESDEPHHKDPEHVLEEKQRRTAFKVDAMQFETADYWCNRIHEKSQNRRLLNELRQQEQRDLFVEAENERQERALAKSERKRKRSAAAFPTPESMSRKRRRSDEVRKSIETIDDSDDDLFVRNSRQLSDPFQTNDFEHESCGDNEDELDQSQLKKIRRENVEHVKKNTPSINNCTIFVGEEYTPFTVCRIASGKCEFLGDREFFEDGMGSYINLYEYSDINKNQFQPIHHYLNYGDFEPRFSRKSDVDRFEETMFLQDQHDEAAKAIIMVYHIAAKIQFQDIQNLCLRKLRLLDMLCPDGFVCLPRIIQMTDRFENDAGEEMLEWLADQISADFWKLVETKWITFSHVMRGYPEFCQRVFRKLAVNPATDYQSLDDD